MANEMKLTAVQQSLVEQHMNLVDVILHTKIRTNENVRGLEYDELYQCGCLALCRAALTFDSDRDVKFETYAGVVIYRALLTQCRKAVQHHGHLLSYDAELGEENTHAIGLRDPHEMDADLQVTELKRLLSAEKQRRHGAVLHGIEAIELQLKGYSGTEIARMYGVKGNNVSSWVAKARAVLRAAYPEYLS